MAFSLKNDLSGLARAARDHLARARMLGQSLDQRAKFEWKKGGGGEFWQPDDAWRADFDKVSQALVQAGNALQKALAANAQKLNGMTVEQLEAQWKAEMLRSAQNFTADDWKVLDDIRMRNALK